MTAAAMADRASRGTATKWTLTPTTWPTLVEALDLKNAIHVGHSTGGGEVARYIGRHGTKRVAKAVLIGAVPPLMLKTAANPGGLPMEVFDGIRAGVLADRSQFFKDLDDAVLRLQPARRQRSRKGCATRSGFRECMAGFKGVVDCIKAFSETDFTEDLKKFDVPTLIMHGDDDQIVPIGASAMLSSKLVKGSTLKVYPGCAARPVLDPQGPGQRGSARVHQGLDDEGRLLRNRLEYCGQELRTSDVRRSHHG